MIQFEIIDKLSIFKDLTEDEKNLLAQLDHEILTYQARDQIVKENDPSNDMYLLLDGSCIVTRMQEDKNLQLAKIASGELFGEMSMFSKRTRTTNVVAKSDVTVLKMDRSFFQKITPEMTVKIYSYIISLLCDRLDKMNENIVRISSLMKCR
jgi:CRP-like cAMP-binding protein